MYVKLLQSSAKQTVDSSVCTDYLLRCNDNIILVPSAVTPNPTLSIEDHLIKADASQLGVFTADLTFTGSYSSSPATTTQTLTLVTQVCHYGDTDWAAFSTEPLKFLIPMNHSAYEIPPQHLMQRIFPILPYCQEFSLNPESFLFPTIRKNNTDTPSIRIDTETGGGSVSLPKSVVTRLTINGVGSSGYKLEMDLDLRVVSYCDISSIVEDSDSVHLQSQGGIRVSSQ